VVSWEWKRQLYVDEEEAAVHCLGKEGCELMRQSSGSCPFRGKREWSVDDDNCKLMRKRSCLLMRTAASWGGKGAVCRWGQLQVDEEMELSFDEDSCQLRRKTGAVSRWVIGSCQFMRKMELSTDEANISVSCCGKGISVRELYTNKSSHGESKQQLK